MGALEKLCLGAPKSLIWHWIPLWKRHIRSRCPRSPASLLTAISSACLAALSAKIPAFNSHTRKNASYLNLKWTLEDLLPCYWYTTETNSETICSQVWQPASAGKGADVSEPQAHHCMTPEQWTWLLCGVSVIAANKRWRQVFWKTSVLDPNFQGGGNARFFPSVNAHGFDVPRVQSCLLVFSVKTHYCGHNAASRWANWSENRRLSA